MLTGSAAGPRNLQTPILSVTVGPVHPDSLSGPANRIYESQKYKSAPGGSLSRPSVLLGSLADPNYIFCRWLASDQVKPKVALPTLNLNHDLTARIWPDGVVLSPRLRAWSPYLAWTIFFQQLPITSTGFDELATSGILVDIRKCTTQHYRSLQKSTPVTRFPKSSELDAVKFVVDLG